MRESVIGFRSHMKLIFVTMLITTAMAAMILLAGVSATVGSTTFTAPFAHSADRKVLRNTLWLSRLKFFAALRANPCELAVIPRPLWELLDRCVLTTWATTRGAPRIARIFDVRF